MAGLVWSGSENSTALQKGRHRPGQEALRWRLRVTSQASVWTHSHRGAVVTEDHSSLKLWLASAPRHSGLNRGGRATDLAHMPTVRAMPVGKSFHGTLFPKAHSFEPSVTQKLLGQNDLAKERW